MSNGVFSGWILGSILRRSGDALQWAIQGDGGINVPRDVQEPCGHGGNGVTVGLNDLRGLF